MTYDDADAFCATNYGPEDDVYGDRARIEPRVHLFPIAGISKMGHTKRSHSPIGGDSRGRSAGMNDKLTAGI